MFKCALLFCFTVFFSLMGISASVEDLMSSNMCVNLMWLNKDPSFDIESVLPTGIESLKTTILAWAEKNPQPRTKVLFWYDGTKTTEAAIEKSVAAVDQALNESVAKEVVTHFMDVNDIFGHPYLAPYRRFLEINSVYAKVDVIRFLIAIYTLTVRKCSTFLYTDLNVKPESREFFFNQQTAEFLNKYGIVMFRHRAEEMLNGGALGFENKFMMLRNDDELLETIKLSLLEPMLRYIEEYDAQPLRDQVVYDGIIYMFAYLFHKKGFMSTSDIPLKVPSLQFDRALRSQAWSNSSHPLTQVLTIKTIASFQTEEDLKTYWTKKCEDIKNRPRQMASEQRERQSFLQDSEAFLQSQMAENRERIQWTKNSWPGDLVIPTIKMQAPRSHFF